MCVGQPVVQRRQSHFRAVADQQEHERDAQHRRFELALHAVEVGPEQRGHSLAAQDLLRGEVQEDRPEQRLRDADAAENEILPAGLQARARPVERDQQHRGERCRLHGDPQQSHVVGRERQQHGEHEELVHAVIQAQAPGRHPAVLHLHAHVGAREQGSGEAHEGRQRYQEDIEGVDEELLVTDKQIAFGDDAHRERAGRQEGAEAEQRVELGRPVARAEHAQDAGTGERYR